MEAVPEPGTMLEVADGLYWVRMPLLGHWIISIFI